MSEKDERGAVLQYEVTPGAKAAYWADDIARKAVEDVFKHGGTFVLVVTDDAITMVQRPAAMLDDE